MFLEVIFANIFHPNIKIMNKKTFWPTTIINTRWRQNFNCLLPSFLICQTEKSMMSYIFNEEERESGEVRGLFDYFDGPTMATYRYPSKDAQVVFCQRDPTPYGSTTDIRDHTALRRPSYEPIGFDPEIPNLSAENFAVSGDGGLVSRVDVPEKSYLMAEQSIHDAQITPSMSAILQSKNEIYDQTIGPVANFVGADRGVLTIPRRVSMKHATNLFVLDFRNID
mgnify:CR=1 FL=1